MPSDPGTAARNGFDKLALAYRWMEYLTFGPFLWRARRTFLPHLLDARSALLLGDGDGRFTAALLRHNPHVRALAVDASVAMLHRLHRRVRRQGDANRLTTLHADALAHLPGGRFDLVCTHFFLDCLTDSQCAALAPRVAARLETSAVWVVSEFAIPHGRLHTPAQVLVRALYVAFGLLTGLRVRALPNYTAALRASGLRRDAVVPHLFGILRSEFWVLSPGSSPEAATAHPTRYE